MSYILDALKRSDQDRQKGSVPDLQTQAEIPPASPPSERRYGRYFWLLLALVSVLLLGFMYGTMNTKEQSAAANTAPAPATLPVTPPANEPANPAIPVSPKTDRLESLRGVQLDTAPIADSAVTPAPGPETPPPVRNTTTETTTPARPAAPPETVTAPKVVAVNSKPADKTPEPTPVDDYYKGIPHQRQLASSLQNGLPELNISVHIYAQQPGARMVRINNTTYREGDRVDRELVLETITPDGVIMSIRNNPFWRRAR